MCRIVSMEFLKDILCVDNIFSILHLAILDEQKELENYCKIFITVNTAAVFKSTGLMECDKEMLACILTMNVFSCSEVDVLDACMAWVQAKSKQTTLTKEIVDLHLGDLLYEIRFKSMTMDEFCALALKYDSVLRNEFITITHMIVHCTIGSNFTTIQCPNYKRKIQSSHWHIQFSLDPAFSIPFASENFQTTIVLTRKK